MQAQLALLGAPRTGNLTGEPSREQAASTWS